MIPHGFFLDVTQLVLLDVVLVAVGVTRDVRKFVNLTIGVTQLGEVVVAIDVRLDDGRDDSAVLAGLRDAAVSLRHCQRRHPRHAAGAVVLGAAVVAVTAIVADDGCASSEEIILK